MFQGTPVSKDLPQPGRTNPEDSTRRKTEPTTPHPGPFSSSEEPVFPGVSGQILPRGEVHQRYRGQLPTRGVLAAGGGLVSHSWRVTVDLELGLLVAHSATRPGVPAYGELGETTKRKLSLEHLERIKTLWGQLLDPSRHPEPQTTVTADSTQLLIACDETDAFELAPPGPITQGSAGRLLKLLGELAWN